MRGDVQVRFGGRTRETHQLKGWQGALARPYSWLAGPVIGVFYYLYFVMDLYSRKIVGYEVYESQSSENLAKVGGF